MPGPNRPTSRREMVFSDYLGLQPRFRERRVEFLVCPQLHPFRKSHKAAWWAET